MFEFCIGLVTGFGLGGFLAVWAMVFAFAKGSEAVRRCCEEVEAQE